MHKENVDYLVIGAGVTGLAFANFAPRGSRVLVVERQHEPGGYCRTVHRDGFVWDYSGHFFHFRHDDIRAFLLERMPGSEVREIRRRAAILYEGRHIDYPFQKNIHQLPFDDFLDCLYELVFRPRSDGPAHSFRQMLHQRFGRGIAERFLEPYNEKLYACSLDTLDADAMGRFFPHADLADIVRNMRFPDDSGYNATFLYPRRGAFEYVRALLRDLEPDAVSCDEEVVSVDLDAHVARTNRREIAYGALVSTAPLVKLYDMVSMPWDRAVYTWNRVLVFNLGFDRKGLRDLHWLYVPDRSLCFYRVGFYDNIFGDDRMSLYVEIGLPAGEPVDPAATLPRVLADLAEAGIVTDQRLVAWHSVVMDPAYVHVRRAAQEDTRARLAELARRDVYSIGRYGGWKYCAIEDNIVEARALAERLTASRTPR